MSIPPVTKTRVFKTDYKENTIQLRPETVLRLKHCYNMQDKDSEIFTYDAVISNLLDFFEKYGPKIR